MTSYRNVKQFLFIQLTDFVIEGFIHLPKCVILKEFWLGTNPQKALRESFFCVSRDGHYVSGR